MLEFKEVAKNVKLEVSMTTKQFSKNLTIRFREGDPARIAYFANTLSWAHDCFEDFIQDAGFGYAEWFRTQQYMVPIRHVECNYLKPFFPGETYQIQAEVVNLGNSSFQMKYTFTQNKHKNAEVLMVHTFLDAATGHKISLPDHVRERLTPYLATHAPHAHQK